MTKTERLLFILNIFRVRKSAKINELAGECNVSRRTIYRDLQALMDMDIPIYSDDGFNLDDEISLPPLNFSREEQELLGYCLINTPLRQSPRLNNILRNIELKIISAIPHIKRDHLCSLVIESDESRKQFPAEIDGIIDNCLKALISGSQLNIKLKGITVRLKTVKPLSFQISENRWKLIVADEFDQKEVSLALEEIEKIEISGA